MHCTGKVSNPYANSKPDGAGYHRLAQIYGFDLMETDQPYLKLEMAGFLPLVVEIIGKHQVSVCHYRYKNGEAIPDPQIVFLVTTSGWVPLSLTQKYFYSKCATAKSDGSRLELANLKAVAATSAFAEEWAANIEAQGWLEPARIKATS